MTADIEATAVDLLREYGKAAWLHASQRVDEYIARADADGQKRWDAILKAIVRLEGANERGSDTSQ